MCEIPVREILRTGTPVRKIPADPAKVLNLFIWDKHAGPRGTAGLAVCVLGAPGDVEAIEAVSSRKETATGKYGSVCVWGGGFGKHDS